jgi:hypothetical protein
MTTRRRSRLRAAPTPLTPLNPDRETARMHQRRAEIQSPTVLQTKTWRRRGRQKRARTVNLTTSPGRGGSGADPMRIIAYRIRRALRPPDPDRSPGLVRRIDPRTGRVIETLDPFTGARRP